MRYTIDTSYRNFLRYANGWRAFYQTVDLFGTNELLDLSIMGNAGRNSLNKEKSSILYEDYAMNESLFHWQSQSRTSTESEIGQRYIHHMYR